MNAKRKQILDKVLDLTHRERVLVQIHEKMTLDNGNDSVLESILTEMIRIDEEFKALESELHESEAM